MTASGSPLSRLFTRFTQWLDQKFGWYRMPLLIGLIILSGVARYIVGNVEHPANVGDVIVLPKGVPHIHPWNVGNDILHVRKITQLDKPDKGLLLKSEEFFETLYALAQEGRIGADGLPKNLLQKVVVGQALEPASFSATPPLWIQRPLFGLLAAIGRAFGYSGYYPAQYVL